jgi:hypothetical protein
MINEKLQKIRCELQKMNIKKSGRNEFSKYDYFELSDFLPKINELLLNEGMTSSMKFVDGYWTLRIISGAESIDFSVPHCTISMKGANEVQCLGAVITYIRRYLYMMAFEIVESDLIDSKPLTHEKNVDDIKLLIADITLKSALVETLTEQQKTYFDNLDPKKYSKELYDRDLNNLNKIIKSQEIPF